MDEGGPGVRETPVSVQVVYRSVGDDAEEEVGEEGEEKQSEGDPEGAVDKTEELGLVRFGCVGV